MAQITKCLNEWNATVEALGQGKQTILIRNYNTTLPNFILYPTVSYALKDNYLESFQPKYRDFVEENALPLKENSKFLVKYFAKVEKVIEKPVSRVGSLKNYYIWTSEHVKSYMNTPKAKVWILRVYELKEPVMAERTRGMRYANLLEPVSLEGIKPVLTDSEFLKTVREIQNK
ncbi:restriction endonuclease [Methanobacterium sp. MZ-A1]|jgi:hypothetical protein|uniref:DUF1802 family protein n=1 Tax=Methanobacterium sp. MZ-A1 TaxID=1911685 RepID=UPI000C2CED65|nr:DUF1802 family protein [Methanobacterium sp. MZ-A1]AUB58812.1 restriction endonuclease [Methanobacterium sp. MZ-A1]